MCILCLTVFCKRIGGFYLNLTIMFSGTWTCRKCLEIRKDNSKVTSIPGARRRSCIADSRILSLSLSLMEGSTLQEESKWRTCARRGTSVRARLATTDSVYALGTSLSARLLFCRSFSSTSSNDIIIAYLSPNDHLTSPNLFQNHQPIHEASLFKPTCPSVYPVSPNLIASHIHLHLSCFKMKFLEHSHFEALNSALNFDAGIYRIIGRYLQLMMLHVLPSLYVQFISLYESKPLFRSFCRGNSFSFSKSTER